MSDQIQKMEEVLKKSLIKIKRLEAELESAQQSVPATKKEPIAIVGLGCRFPGGIENLESLWEALVEKKDLSQPIPKDRWDNDLIYDPDPLRPGKTNAQTAMFLDHDVKAFDAGFFGVIPREAKSIDPLQRMILEVVYEALEEANIPSDQLRGTNTAVYIAIGNSDYIQARFRSGNLESVDVYDATGIPFATASGRVSYLYDLQGTSYAIDAACASSILGMHLAAEELSQGKADCAIVASANLLLTPELFVGLAKLGSLSSSGQCRAFSNDGDGYVRGEGCGVVILKRKTDALNDHNHVHAYILGSAVKHDGLSNGFTAPNPQVQLETIRLAIEDAGVQPSDISFVEAHGIGNKFTDAMEINAIANGYKSTRQPIYVGSVKTNIGHLEATTGMAMLYKVIGTLKNKTIAPNLYFNEPNSDILWDRIPIKVATEPIEIEDNGQPIRAAINLSGYSGTNVHMIFEAAEQETSQADENEKTQVLVWSAKSEQALKGLIEKYLAQWSQLTQNNFKSFAHTLQSGRTHWEVRLSIVASNYEDVRKGLESFISEEKLYPYKYTKELDASSTAFLFTGQGAQYHGMCKDLYDQERVFRDTVDQCAAYLDKMLPKSIKDVMWGDEDQQLVHQTFYTQTSLFVVEYALAQLWLSRGVQPSALIGHSIGEFVALTVAGAMSLKDALKIVAIRGHLMQSLPTGVGAMAAVLSDEEKVRFYTDQTKGLVNIAAINTPNVITISGEKRAVETLVEAMREVKIRSKMLTVSHAFHSHMMEPIMNQFEEKVAGIRFREPQLPVVSNITGRELRVEDLTPQYFSRHLREEVRFSDGVQYLSEELGVNTFIECGPAPTLVSFASKVLSNENNIFVSSAKRNTESRIEQTKALQQLYHSGVRFDFSQLSFDKKISKVSLPTYAWQREIYWENPVRGVIGIEQPAMTTTQERVDYMKEEMVKAKAKDTKITKENLMAIMQLEGAEILGLLPGQKIDPNLPLREQGFDSMMSGEFLSKMEKHFGVQLEMSLIHTYGSFNELQRHFIDEYLGGGEVDESQAAVSMSDIVFGTDNVGEVNDENWHEIKDTDSKWLRVFKKIDKMLSTPKD